LVGDRAIGAVCCDLQTVRRTPRGSRRLCNRAHKAVSEFSSAHGLLGEKFGRRNRKGKGVREANDFSWEIPNHRTNQASSQARFVTVKKKLRRGSHNQPLRRAEARSRVRTDGWGRRVSTRNADRLGHKREHAESVWQVGPSVCGNLRIVAQSGCGGKVGREPGIWPMSSSGAHPFFVLLSIFFSISKFSLQIQFKFKHMF
jgi:hypothetical protein